MSRSDLTDFSKTLDELQGLDSGSADDAETPLVADIIRARQKPLNALAPYEIGRLIVQLDGLPFILDVVLPLLEEDPLFDGGYYPGDVLSNLIRADTHI